MARHKTNKVHRERHQPINRSHLGPLEKKKDYVKRAKDANSKALLIRRLHRRALFKNPDEFHFHMINSQIKDGVHYEKTTDEELTMKDVMKDLIYITHRRAMERKKIQKLQASLHLISEDAAEMSDISIKKKHILFVDTEKEAKRTTPDQILETHPSLLKRSFNRLKKDQLKKMTLDVTSGREGGNGVQECKKHRNKAYKELVARMEREEKLRLLQEKLEVRRKLMDRKNTNAPLPALIQEGTKTSAPIYKWPNERKK